jgi:hypothetical protein
MKIPDHHEKKLGSYNGEEQFSIFYPLAYLPDIVKDQVNTE